MKNQFVYFVEKEYPMVIFVVKNVIGLGGMVTKQVLKK